MAAIIAGQLGTGMIMDHFGMFGGRHIPLDSSRMIGVSLLMAGGWLVFRRVAS